MESRGSATMLQQQHPPVTAASPLSRSSTENPRSISILSSQQVCATHSTAQHSKAQHTGRRGRTSSHCCFISKWRQHKPKPDTEQTDWNGPPPKEAAAGHICRWWWLQVLAVLDELRCNTHPEAERAQVDGELDSCCNGAVESLQPTQYCLEHLIVDQALRN